MAGINEPIIKRYEKNPILTKHDVPYPVKTVYNAGVVKHNSKYIMLFRSHCRNGRSIIGLAESDDGLIIIKKLVIWHIINHFHLRDGMA